MNEYCDEFLVHAVDVEGHANGIEEEVVNILADYSTNTIYSGCSTGVVSTYAGGISSYEDIEFIKSLSKGRIDYTIGSSLDFFGGSLSFKKIAQLYS